MNLRRFFSTALACACAGVLFLRAGQAGEPSAPAAASLQAMRFREHLISKEIKFGYQLVVADLTGDGKKDVIAVDEMATCEIAQWP